MKAAKPQPFTTFATIVGSALRSCRIRAGVDQKTLSSLMFITPGTLSRIENGKSAFTIDQLAMASWEVRVSPGDVVGIADFVREKLLSSGCLVTSGGQISPCVNPPRRISISREEIRAMCDRVVQLKALGKNVKKK